jgi:hypothetical protein
VNECHEVDLGECSALAYRFELLSVFRFREQLLECIFQQSVIRLGVGEMQEIWVLLVQLCLIVL